MNLTLAAKIAAQRFVVTGELTPPKGTDLTKLFATAELLRSSVDALNVTESPRARMAMDPRAVGKLLQDRGIEVIVQVTSRDRNRIAVQSDLLGAAALGLRNFVFMGGDSPAGGDHPDAKPVFDLTASGLLAAAEALRNGKDYAGNVLHGTPELFLGATCQPGRTQVRSRGGEHAPQDRRRREAAADPGHLPRRPAAAFHGCGEAGWRGRAGRHHSVEVGEEWSVAQYEPARRGGAPGHAPGHGRSRQAGARA
jgi:5,10-methylenetetrahydrofolate reductase